MSFRFTCWRLIALLALPARAGAQVEGSVDSQRRRQRRTASPPSTDQAEDTACLPQRAPTRPMQKRVKQPRRSRRGSQPDAQTPSASTQTEAAAEAQAQPAPETQPVETQTEAATEAQAQPASEAQPAETQTEVATEAQTQPAPEAQPVENQAEVATETQAAPAASEPAQQPADSAQTLPAPSAPAQQPADTAQTQPAPATEPAQQPAATAQTQPAPAAQPAQVTVASAADIRAGIPVLDPQGGTVGTVESVAADGAVVATGTARARIPLASFGKSDRGLVISVTRAQLEAAVSAQSPS